MARICDTCGMEASSVGRLYGCACGRDFCSMHGDVSRGLCDLCIASGVPVKTKPPGVPEIDIPEVPQ